ncbi:MAG: hypothetical protein ACOC16_00525 [Nanoarchaeota archaeon]
MRAHNYFEKIPLYRKTNPNLNDKDIGTLLLIDNIYLEIPKEVQNFKTKYQYFDPKFINNFENTLKFLEIINNHHYSKSKIKEELNNYLNVKFNYIGYEKTYNENQKKFKIYSSIASKVILEILNQARFSQELMSILNEIKELQDCSDIYELYLLYQHNSSPIIRFSVLRKLGLIILLARIDKTYTIEDLDFAMEKIKKALVTHLYKKKNRNKIYFFWADESYKLNLFTREKQAIKNYVKTCKKRQALASKIYDMQIFQTKSFSTKHNNKIVNIALRNKLKRDTQISYTSVVEKMIRKNLEFPNQIHDIIGLKIVADNSEDIPSLIDELENFLGGSSTRKREKNSFKKFGKKLLNKYSSGEYTVWKAVYDIAVPNPSINKIKEIVDLTQNKTIKSFLNERINYFYNNPKDFVVEVQIQDLKSYLLSAAKGSLPFHDNLKMTQIKENTFYKLFPVEIYKSEFVKLKSKILSNSLN